MKRLLILLFVFAELCANSQTKPSYFTPVATAYEWNWGRFKYGLRPPPDTLPTADSGSIAYKNGVWYGKNQYWSALGGYGGGSDSSLFATRYWAYNTFQPIGSYLTASDLTSYYTKTQINGFFSGVSSISGYNKSNWDAVHSAWAAVQALSPSGWATQSALVDSANQLRAAIGSGGGGSGDMTKAVYDANNNGIVDVLELSGVVIGNGTSSPTSITGTANQLLRRNAANTAYEFFTPSYLTSVDTPNISSFSVKVRSLFNGTSPIAYANGNISLDTSSGKWRSENYYDTKYQPIGSYINPPDTANNWASNFYKRNDSVFFQKGTTEYFAFKDSSGSGAITLLVKSSGVGQDLWYDLADDTLRIKRIIGDGLVSTYTSSDSTLHVSVDLSTYVLRTELQDTAAAIRAAMGTGNGIIRSGVYGPGGSSYAWIDTTIHRLVFKDGNTIYRTPITDSIDATVYDTDAQTYFDNVAAAGVTLNTSQKTAFNTYITNSKTHGTWTKLYDAPMPIWGTSAASAVMLKGTHTITWINSPTFDAYGVAGNGTSSYGNLNFSPTTAFLSQDRAAIGVYVQTNVTDANMVEIGSLSTTPTRGARVNTKANASTSIILNDATVVAQTVSTSAGFLLINRTSSSNVDTYKNGTLLTGSGASTSVGLATDNFYICASNQAGSASLFSTRKISAVLIFKDTLTSTEAGYAASDLNALMTALGINVY